MRARESRNRRPGRLSIFPQTYRAKLIQIAAPKFRCVFASSITRRHVLLSPYRENVPPSPPPLLPFRGGRKPTRFTIVNERRSRPTNPYNNLAPVHRPAYVEMLANRGESVRKLVELQPLPVIKSKERRRYGRRASAAVEYEKGAGRGARIILSQCLNEDVYIRSCTSGHDHHHQHVFIEIHLN